MFKKACNLIGNVEIETLPEDCHRELTRILAEKINSKIESLGLRLVFQYDEYYDDVEYLILVQIPSLSDQVSDQ